jgi:hypothetical protein
MSALWSPLVVLTQSLTGFDHGYVKTRFRRVAERGFLNRATTTDPNRTFGFRGAMFRGEFYLENSSEVLTPPRPVCDMRGEIDVKTEGPIAEWNRRLRGR